MRTFLIPLIGATALAGSTLSTLAQNSTAAGAADGAAAGSAAAGPIGGLVGGVTGAAVGTAAGVTGAVLGAPAAVAPPTTVRRSTCVTEPDGSQRCDSVETTN
ncbi:hypothetical protein [Lichenifustis flavocetrariae]|uniref:Glycine zipper domain-containing protein n=1 Tax=Lichenifustis flavocetrariae TaxID=2949735 RepID=A0AA41YWY1_9HYPH|nr:hypothetical protein [Lichenifustis flavocetrariae]MCW6506458.1 hypothetical protein [Lichenifustis flavocetrariae]